MVSGFAGLLVSSMIMMTACTKEGPALFKGYYSYKTSGTLVVERVGTDSQTGEETKDTLDVQLTSELGQMDIISQGDGSNRMFVTMNAMAGDVIKFDAVAEPSSISLKPLDRIITVDVGNATLIPLNMTVSGTGKRYDNMVIFTLDYSGGCEQSGNIFRVLDSDVVCVAKINK